jgi:hypothetical protein
MARDVATMFDELKALADRHAELYADRARLAADVDRPAAAPAPKPPCAAAMRSSAV